MLGPAMFLAITVVSLPALAQFRSIEIQFEGIGCASCVESLPSRAQRIRGVESATVDAEHGILKLQLAEQNRVRLEQIRDLIEQDGTKASKAVVRLKGELTEQDGRIVLQPTGVSASYEVRSSDHAAPGTYVVSGEVATLRPESGRIVIAAREVQKVP